MTDKYLAVIENDHARMIRFASQIRPVCTFEIIDCIKAQDVIDEVDREASEC